MEAGSGSFGRAGARWLWRGVPVVASQPHTPGLALLFAPGPAAVAPEEAPRAARELVAKVDADLAARAAASLEAALADGPGAAGRLLGLCDDCAAASREVLGVVLPRREVACAGCGRRGWIRLATGPCRLY
ncbi:MAG: hypothetical protein K6T75_03935 [Acetobacteraceae bacterium]|nr:hypothetical protein [Acetobacteraceae bacterium]